MKNALLILGLIISLISIGFHVLVYGYHNDLISDKEDELSFINFTNLYLSNEFNHAENIFYKSRNIEYWLDNLNLNKSNLFDSISLQMMEEDLGMMRFKSVNYALNSSVDYVNTDYDLSEIKELMVDMNNLNIEKRLESNRLDTLKSKYIEYYKRHEEFIRKNMIKKIKLKTEVRELKKNNSWMKLLAISFQTIGLILVFLKDTEKKPNQFLTPKN